MLTAKVEDMDKIMGADSGRRRLYHQTLQPAGADRPGQNRQLRRYKSYNHAGETPQAFHDIRGLTINKDTHACTLFGETIALTPLEFPSFGISAENKGKVVISEELFEKVWGEKYLDNSNNTVMAHIGRLREKLKEPAKHPKFIKTVWGVGYKIEA